MRKREKKLKKEAFIDKLMFICSFVMRTSSTPLLLPPSTTFIEDVFVEEAEVSASVAG